ncbi:MAG TPA: hypothetical protein VG097_00540 [Gemmata sp.]|jgi:hypothetical protein|nr:hypothetical protein [Gemmata sp.]
MRKTLSIARKVALAIIIVIVSYVVLYIFYCDDGFDDSKGGKTLAELQTLGGAMRKLINEELTPERLKMVHSMEDIVPLLGSMIEGNPDLKDPWGNQYLLDKREENGLIMITIRSSWRPPRKCFEWKRKVAGVELTVSEQGKVTEIKHLWM